LWVEKSLSNGILDFLAAQCPAGITIRHSDRFLSTAEVSRLKTSQILTQHTIKETAASFPLLSAQPSSATAVTAFVFVPALMPGGIGHCATVQVLCTGTIHVSNLSALLEKLLNLNF
jgi:hypothetical protein